MFLSFLHYLRSRFKWIRNELTDRHFAKRLVELIADFANKINREMKAVPKYVTTFRHFLMFFCIASEIVIWRLFMGIAGGVFFL